MKKLILTLVTLGAAAAIVWLGWFGWENFRGVGPAIKPAAGDIAETINSTPPEAQNSTDFPLDLPDGFAISVFAQDYLERPRDLELDPTGALIVSDVGRNAVFALVDENGNGIVDETVTVAQNLNHPHGLAFRCEGDGCSLYIAEENQVGRWDYDRISHVASNKKTIIELPSGGAHTTRSLIFRPDGRLLVSVGSTCNACLEEDSQRATVLSANPDGSDLQNLANGLRNAVFMTVHPSTETVWVTEMGRDYLGDDLPPDEINVLRDELSNYGWPNCYGNNVSDRTFDDPRQFLVDPCSIAVPSRLDLPAHSAPLGLDFIEGDGWPEDLQGDLLVSYHGSWNRSQPTGYKIVKFENPFYRCPDNARCVNPSLSEDFISGWLTGSSALGRPVDVLVQPDGTLYISDDKAGLVYRVSRQ